MVDPPTSNIALVCCVTTKGPLTIAVRPRWAPRGARRFYDMVRSNYFSARIPLFRCIKSFLCQWGIAGREHTPDEFRKSFADDPSWLPWGPKYWSVDGVARFAAIIEIDEHWRMVIRPQPKMRSQQPAQRSEERLSEKEKMRARLEAMAARRGIDASNRVVQAAGRFDVDRPPSLGSSPPSARRLPREP